MIVAFLQNAWFTDPDKVSRMIARDTTGNLRQRVIKYSLFAGCLTGRRLRKAFGARCDDILWEEANPIFAGNPRDYYAPDAQHIESVMRKHKPRVVLCFTKTGEHAVREACVRHNALLIPVVHPACRAADTMSKLRAAAAQLDAL